MATAWVAVAGTDLYKVLAKGVVAAIRMLLGGLSMFEFKDGKRPGVVLKWPVLPPAPPPSSDPEVRS